MSVEELSDSDFEADEDVSICYIEPNYGKAARLGGPLSSCCDEEWKKVRPPKRSGQYNPCVTARQIDLIRSLLLGKHGLKSETQTQMSDFKKESYAEGSSVTLKKRKSSVKFFIQHQIYD